MVASGHSGADRRATASLATRSALPGRSKRRMTSYPPDSNWPKAWGYDRRWVSASPTAVASMPPPHSTRCWLMRWPWLETNHFRVSQAVTKARARATPSTACIVVVTSTRRSAFSASDTAKGSSTCGVS